MLGWAGFGFLGCSLETPDIDEYVRRSWDALSVAEVSSKGHHQSHPLLHSISPSHPTQNWCNSWNWWTHCLQNSGVLLWSCNSMDDKPLLPVLNVPYSRFASTGSILVLPTLEDSGLSLKLLQSAPMDGLWGMKNVIFRRSWDNMSTQAQKSLSK